mmetsp:Transcript_33159/g.59515  ORF Transcript_33159/g.59515 Transcript_33159/m.59515 type:complete len:363 (-) Transcript_33159:1040-2128(-)
MRGLEQRIEAEMPRAAVDHRFVCYLKDRLEADAFPPNALTPISALRLGGAVYAAQCLHILLLEANLVRQGHQLPLLEHQLETWQKSVLASSGDIGAVIRILQELEDEVVLLAVEILPEALQGAAEIQLQLGGTCLVEQEASADALNLLCCNTRRLIWRSLCSISASAASGSHGGRCCVTCPCLSADDFPWGRRWIDLVRSTVCLLRWSRFRDWCNLANVWESLSARILLHAQGSEQKRSGTFVCRTWRFSQHFSPFWHSPAVPQKSQHPGATEVPCRCQSCSDLILEAGQDRHLPNCCAKSAWKLLQERYAKGSPKNSGAVSAASAEGLPLTPRRCSHKAFQPTIYVITKGCSIARVRHAEG